MLAQIRHFYFCNNNNNFEIKHQRAACIKWINNLIISGTKISSHLNRRMTENI